MKYISMLRIWMPNEICVIHGSWKINYILKWRQVIRWKVVEFSTNHITIDIHRYQWSDVLLLYNYHLTLLILLVFFVSWQLISQTEHNDPAAMSWSFQIMSSIRFAASKFDIHTNVIKLLFIHHDTAPDLI